MSINVSQSPFFDINNCCDLFQKLGYDFNNLSRENMNPYFLMNFLSTSNHLQDWISKDKNVYQNIKIDLKETFSLQKNVEFSIIKSLCNRSKHFEKAKHDYSKVKIEGFSFENLDFSTASFGGDEYYVVVRNEKRNVFDICKKNYDDWNAFFRKYGQDFISLGYMKAMGQ